MPHTCTWERDNLLKTFDKTSFTYNYQGNRVLKSTTNGQTVNYYYDGSKLLGEDYNDGTKLRYIYDLTGICGLCYKKDSSTAFYEYAKDGQGNVVALVRDGQIIEEYYYDAWGNTKVEIKNKILIINFEDFQFIVWIEKSIFGDHYKILSNIYIPEMHSFKEIASINSCEIKLCFDLQYPENFFSKELLQNNQDEAMFTYIKKIFDKVLKKINTKGISYFYNKKTPSFYSDEFQKFINLKQIK